MLQPHPDDHGTGGHPDGARPSGRKAVEERIAELLDVAPPFTAEEVAELRQLLTPPGRLRSQATTDTRPGSKPRPRTLAT